MYTYYIIRLDFKDGNWGYVQWAGRGDLRLTDDPNSCMVFDTKQEASDYYYDNIGSGVTCNGSSLDRVFITTITSQYPM